MVSWFVCAIRNKQGEPCSEFLLGLEAHWVVLDLPLSLRQVVRLVEQTPAIADRWFKHVLMGLWPLWGSELIVQW